MRFIKVHRKRALVIALVAAVSALLVMTMALGGVAAAQGPDFDWDQEFPYTVYLVHITETGTVSGPMEKDVYILFPKPPEDGVLLTADGYGGWFINKAEAASGGLTTPRQVCAAIGGIPAEKLSLFGQVPQLPDFSCSQLEEAGPGPEEEGGETIESSTVGQEPVEDPAEGQESDSLEEPESEPAGDTNSATDEGDEDNEVGSTRTTDLVRELEKLVGGKGAKAPTPARAAAAGAGTSALLGLWALNAGLGLGSTPPPTTSGEQPTQDTIEWKKRMLELYFEMAVENAIAGGFMVDNRTLVEKAFLRFPLSGRAAHRLGGVTGGQCGEFAEWGVKWIKQYAEQIFGEGVIVDTIRIEERSSARPQVLVHDPIEWADSWVQANHAATRMILPNGETYVLDFWQAVGDRQRSHYDRVVDQTYEKIFGSLPGDSEVKIMKESEWIKKWSDKIGEPGDPAVVHNLNEDQHTLKTMISTLGDEEKGIQAFRKAMTSKIPAQKLETIINSYREGGVRWGRKF